VSWWLVEIRHRPEDDPIVSSDRDPATQGVDPDMSRGIDIGFEAVWLLPGYTADPQNAVTT
jgi:hypothetical protein